MRENVLNKNFDSRGSDDLIYFSDTSIITLSVNKSLLQTALTVTRGNFTYPDNRASGLVDTYTSITLGVGQWNGINRVTYGNNDGTLNVGKDPLIIGQVAKGTFEKSSSLSDFISNINVPAYTKYSGVLSRLYEELSANDLLKILRDWTKDDKLNHQHIAPLSMWMTDPFNFNSNSLMLATSETTGMQNPSKSNNSRIISFSESSDIKDMTSQLLGSAGDAGNLFNSNDDIWMEVSTKSWNEKVQIKRVVKASDIGDFLEGKQRDPLVDGVVGSILAGGKGNDRIQGKAGWDIADGGEGNDLVKTGNGRDILTGGLGSDELWGGFGWNTYRGDKDGSADLIVIRSDEHLVNPMVGKAGNNADGSKCDIIEALDAIDKIIIIGVNTSDITVRNNVTGQGLTGIGIYAKGSLEALYTGGDLSVEQLAAMTTGDASSTAINGTIASYWF